MKVITAILHRAAVFAAVMTVLWAALTAAAAIPNERIYDNMLSSAMYYKDKEPFPFDSQMRLVQDNYADAILLNVTWNMGRGAPFSSALNTAYYDGNDGRDDYGENWGLYCAVQGTAEPNTDYTRYWHGMAAVIRPLMLFTDVSGIKLMGTAAAFVLLAANAALLLNKRQYFAAGGLAAAFLCVHVWNIGLAMEYQPARSAEQYAADFQMRLGVGTVLHRYISREMERCKPYHRGKQIHISAYFRRDTNSRRSGRAIPGKAVLSCPGSKYFNSFRRHRTC